MKIIKNTTKRKIFNVKEKKAEIILKKKELKCKSCNANNNLTILSCFLHDTTEGIRFFGLKISEWNSRNIFVDLWCTTCKDISHYSFDPLDLIISMKEFILIHEYEFDLT